MTKQISRWVLAVLSAGLASCAPMEQAPLIYSSAEKGGLNISTTPSSTTALDISVGFSIIDATYVPVEVAKHCQSTATDCSNLIYAPQQVLGNNKVNSLPSSATIQNLANAYSAADAKLKAAQSALDSALSKQASDQKLLAAQTIAQTKIATDNNLISELSAKKLATPSDANLDSAISDANETLKRDQDAFDAANSSVSGIDIAADASAVQSAQSSVIAATAEDSNAQAALSSASDNGSSNVKGDALSVFGSFNDSTQAGGSTSTRGGAQPSGSLTLGKIFATGVAAQDISEGITASAVANCLSNATTAAALISDATAKQTFLSQTLSNCSSIKR